MRVSILLLFTFVAILAVGARADAPDKKEAVMKKMQELIKEATEAVKTAMTIMRESDAAQQARTWLSDNTNVVKQQLAQLREQVTALLKQTPSA